MTESNDYLGSLDPDELQAEQEFLDNHWANDLLDAPHALIAVIETKIARAVIAEREQIIAMMETSRCACGACIDCQATDFYMQEIRKRKDD